MKSEHDLPAMKSQKNPYTQMLKMPAAIYLSKDVIIYFKNMIKKNDIPQKSLVDFYLQEGVAEDRKLDLRWHGKAQAEIPRVAQHAPRSVLGAGCRTEESRASPTKKR